jgi:hypothetical protein
MALSDLAIKRAKPAPKPYKLADSGGLFLLVTPTGGKLWRVAIRIDEDQIEIIDLDYEDYH